MDIRHKYINEFKEELVSNLSTLVKIIPLFIPADDIDKKILTVGLDMLETLKNDIEATETIGELSRYVNISKLEENWEDMKEKVTNINSSEVRVALNDIVERFRVGGEYE